MDLRYFLESRLNFIEQLYESATGPFEEIKHKIDEGEEPYVDRRDPEYISEPAFLAEYQEASDSVEVIGNWCLSMVQISLKAYLQEYIGPRGSLPWDSKVLKQELAKKQGNWFARYQLLFLDMGIDWKDAPIAVSELEQLNLTRDDLIHNGDIFTVDVERSDSHVQRFPVGLFTDNMWSQLGSDRLRINREKLQLATRLVRNFCSWLEECRPWSRA